MTRSAASWPSLGLPFTSTTRVEGPRRWWNGPLDVEALAVGSVAAAVGAADGLAAARGSVWDAFVASGLVGASFGSIGRLRVDGRPQAEWAPLSGFFQTADGWIRLHGNYPHHAAVIGAVLGSTDRESAAAAVRRWDATALEPELRAAGGIAGAVRTCEQWQRHAQYPAVVAAGPIRTGSSTGARAPLSPTSGPPMTGLRVLDLTRVIAGPTATRFLAALGADVRRIDPPARPELLTQHLDTDFAKHSACLDLNDPEHLATARTLAAEADVVITGYRPGALARFGFDHVALLQANPALVVVELSAWTTDGPWREQRGFDSIVQAVTGIADRYATSDGPGALPVQALDHATGSFAATAAMRLLARRPTEGGAAAQVSLAATAQTLLSLPEPPPAEPAAFDGPDLPVWIDSTDTAYGTVEHVRPPVLVEGVPLSYPFGPTHYGTDCPEWWGERD